MMEYLFTRTPLFFFTQSFWRDEGFTYLMAKLPILEILKTTAHDFNPPTYYILMHYWMMIFGSSEIAMRSLSVIFFAINIYFFYLFCKNIFKIKSKIIWIYTLLFALNPFLVYYAFEARMYSMFGLLTTLSMYFFLQKKWGKYLLFSIMGIYTHYFFIFVLASQIIYSVICQPGLTKRNAKVSMLNIFRDSIGHFMASRMTKNFAIIGLCFLPWFIYIFPTISSKTNNFWMGKLNWFEIYNSIGVLFTGYEGVYGFYDKNVIVLSTILITIIVIGIFKFRRAHLPSQRRDGDDSLFRLLFLWGLGFYLFIAILSLIKPIYTPRYLIFSAVGFMFFLVYVLEHYPKFLKLSLIVLIFFYTLSYNNLQVLHKRKGDVRSTVNKIKIQIKDNDSIYVKNETMYFTMGYYFPANKVFVYGKNYDQIPYYVGLALLPRDRFVNKLPAYPSKAFILIDDYNYIVQSIL